MSASIERNKELGRRFTEVLNNRQWDLLDELVAPDFQRHCQATPGVVVKSLEEFKAFLRADAASFPDSVQTPRLIVAEDDMIAVWAAYEGTQLGQMGPFPPSGKRMSIDFSAMIRVEAGKIAELWVVWDNVAALTQLGHLPAPGKIG